MFNERKNELMKNERKEGREKMVQVLNTQH